MKNNIIKSMLLCCMLVLVNWSHGGVIQPVEATASTSWTAAGGHPGMLIDGSGFTESSPIEASTVTNEQTPWTYWHNNGFEEPLTDTWIAFDLGALSELDSMVVWNFNVDIPGEDLTPMGIKDFDLRLSANSEFGDGDDIVLAGLALNEASGLSSESGQVIALGGVSGIRYVQIKVLTNHSYDGFVLPGFVGLSEVRFTGIPEPASLILLGLGSLSLLKRRK